MILLFETIIPKYVSLISLTINYFTFLNNHTNPIVRLKVKLIVIILESSLYASHNFQRILQTILHFHNQKLKNVLKQVL